MCRRSSSNRKWSLLNTDSLSGSCAQETQRKRSVKEYCLIDDNSGLCKITTDCTTMTSPARGTCSNINHVCCIVQAPDQVNTTTVAKYLDNIVSVFGNTEKKNLNFEV